MSNGIPPVALYLLVFFLVYLTSGFRIIESSEGQGFPQDTTDILTVKKISFPLDNEDIFAVENLESSSLSDNLTVKKVEAPLDSKGIPDTLSAENIINSNLEKGQAKDIRIKLNYSNENVDIKSDSNSTFKEDFSPNLIQTTPDSDQSRGIENGNWTENKKDLNATLTHGLKITKLHKLATEKNSTSGLPLRITPDGTLLLTESSEFSVNNKKSSKITTVPSNRRPQTKENMEIFSDSTPTFPNGKTLNASLEDKWMELEKTFRLYTDTIMKKALPLILRVQSQLNISSQCNGGLLQLVNGIRKLKSWAIKMVDANGRLPSGSLEGTLTDLGEYDQCLDVEQPKRNKHVNIRGKYCTLELKPTLPALQNSVTLNTKVLDFGNIPIDSVLSDFAHGSALFHFMVMRIGVCVPSPCVADDIREMASALLKTAPVEVSVRNCETKEVTHLTIPQYIVIMIFSIIAIFILTGTVADLYTSRNPIGIFDIERVPQSLLAFSLSLNLKKLLKCSRAKSKLGAVNGIRCLSLMWIVLAHTYGFGHRQGLARLNQAKTYMDDIFFQIITNAWVSVDTFFLLGGLLVATSNLKLIEKSGRNISYASHIIHRIWRLTPPVAATLGLMFLLPLIGSGPLWRDMVGQKVSNCEQRWWQVFLPINTWVDFSNMCLLHTWYVASDMHFYCLAPLALTVLYKWPTFGFSLLFFTTSVCSLVTGILTIVNNLPPTVIFFSPDVELTKRTANLIYFRPYPHVGAYCVGLALGYILWKKQKWSLSKVTQSAGWAVSSVSCLAVLFATYLWSRGTAADTVEGVIYAVLHRTVWAAGVAWVLFTCATGHGGMLNKFLSWQAFTPLSRLCYSVYLLHFPVLWVRVSWRRSLLQFHHYDIVTEFLGILMITLALSIIFHLSFEAPFLNLEQLWFPERRKSSEETKTIENKTAT
ncbi:O-acyltransferase like protein-like [Parasteatoda tepidariorum]|uniref:O-acyltransferase like protein-like n=1 Tax=Parasteatoda tepidariorum TaxID=114398 RepID=UPI00077F8378|nr:nose resistant to fluoxetine protein 6-like [Parasteatoda tepidariorum]